MKSLPGLLMFLALPVLAQEETPPAEATTTAVNQPPCSSVMHRQFDFWLGHWTVTAGGQLAGQNHIESLHDGCVLAEHWESAQGNFSGSSLNMYDAANGQWHQTWVDTSGTLLRLDGGLSDGQMVLEGTRPGPGDTVIAHRISWTPSEDGTVRQHWETHSGDGEWNTVFDGLYTRKSD